MTANYGPIRRTRHRHLMWARQAAPIWPALRAAVLVRSLPWLEAKHQGDVAVFASNWFSPHHAYRLPVQDSIYVADSARDRGLSRTLLADLMRQARGRPLRAVTGDSANAAFIGGHGVFGFTEAGVMRSVG